MGITYELERVQFDYSSVRIIVEEGLADNPAAVSRADVRSIGALPLIRGAAIGISEYYKYITDPSREDILEFHASIEGLGNQIGDYIDVIDAVSSKVSETDAKYLAQFRELLPEVHSNLRTIAHRAYTIYESLSAERTIIEGSIPAHEAQPIPDPLQKRLEQLAQLAVVSLEDSPSRDVLRSIALHGASIEHHESELRNAVAQARSEGVSWAAIGQVVGISSQAAYRRWDPNGRAKSTAYQQRRRQQQ